MDRCHAHVVWPRRQDQLVQPHHQRCVATSSDVVVAVRTYHGTGFGNCIQNAKGSIAPAALAKYDAFYAAVNDQGPLFGGGKCRDNPNAPDYPICDNQANCGKCYALRCVRPCRGKEVCAGNTCKPGTVTVLMVDACPASSPLQIKLQAQYGYNGCIAAAQSNSNHFDVSPEALNALRAGDSGEADIEFQEVPC